MKTDTQEKLKEVMRLYPQGVTVVTTSYGGRHYGITVSSFTSISLNPPLVMISISKTSWLNGIFTNSEYFAVNLLAEDQKSVSDRFAGREGVEERFRGIKFTVTEKGSPIIHGVRAYLECKRWNIYDGGDHSIIVGEVVDGRKLSNRQPLAYYMQQYVTLTSAGVENVPELLW